MRTDSSNVDVTRLVTILGQLAAVAMLFHALQLESTAFTYKVLPLTLGGFVVHYFLPARYRLPFFTSLCLFGIVTVFGLINGGWLIGVGVALVVIAHLPISFGVRIALLILTGAALAVSRAGMMPAPWAGAIWPVLGSMFMFRLVVYMYDLRNSREPLNVSRVLAYFFLLPNLAFPLFPVVDYATFRRTYYDQERHEIYQRGAAWMLRGTAHLILYRLVYQYLVIAPADIASAADLVRYLVSNFLLYLRVSGQFHLIAGMLHLFGFRLPETHHFFYLASSFTDFWRRINIYWKDFMLKVFYYPAFFRLRKRGDTFALVLSTLFVFAVTWFFHSYQWFWILGRVLLSWTDVLFWLILAILLVFNSLWEMKRGRRRAFGEERINWYGRLRKAAQISATFTVLCVLWSLWTSATLSEWVSLWRNAQLRGPGLLTLAGAFAVVAGITIVAEPLQRASVGALASLSPRVRLASAFSVLLVAAVAPLLGAGLGSGARAALADFRSNELNTRDAAMLRQGYYENLTNLDPMNSRVWEETKTRPADWRPLRETAAVRNTGDFLEFEIVPNASIVLYGAPLTTNAWGMRDRNYSHERAGDVARVAILGTSATIGVGVRDGEPFEAVLEQQMGGTVEILNFAVAGYAATQQLVLLDRALEFKPDALWYIAHPAAEQSFIVAHLARCLAAGIAPPFEPLRHLTAGLDTNAPAEEMAVSLRRMQDTLLLAAYQEIARKAREHGARPIFIGLLLPGDHPPRQEIRRTLELATRAGFAVIDLTDVYAGHDVRELQIASWDRHPNAAAHRLIAERLHQLILSQPALLAALDTH